LADDEPLEEIVKRRDFGRLMAALGGGAVAAGLDQERLLSAFGQLTRVDEQLLRDLEALTLDYARRHRTTAPRNVLPELTNHVLRLRGLLDQAPARLLSRLQVDVAEAAITTGWLNWYTENRSHAEAWWNYAILTMDTELQAHALVAASSLHSSQGWRPTSGLGALERLDAGLDLLGPQGAPRLGAWLHGRRAEEYALGGAGTLAYRELEAAGTAMARARAEDGIWAGARDSAHLEAYRGNVAMRLGRGEEAELSLEQVLAGTPDGYMTGRCWSLLDLSEARALRGDGEGAVGALSQAVGLAGRGGLTAYLYRAQAIRQGLKPWAGAPAARALDEQFASLSRTSGPAPLHL
jgi:hypothetical protein